MYVHKHKKKWLFYDMSPLNCTKTYIEHAKENIGFTIGLKLKIIGNN